MSVATLTDFHRMLERSAPPKEPGTTWHMLLPLVLYNAWLSRELAAIVRGFASLPQSVVDDFSEEDFKHFDENTSRVLKVIDSFLDGTLPMTKRRRAKILGTRQRMVDARRAIERGYAPGQLPQRKDREAVSADLGNLHS